LRFFVITDAIRSNLFANFVDAYMHPSRASREFMHRGLVSIRRSRAPWTSAVRYNIGEKERRKLTTFLFFVLFFLRRGSNLSYPRHNILWDISLFSISFFERWRFDSVVKLFGIDLG